MFIRPTKSGVNFKDEKLFIFTTNSITVVKGWPQPMAWRKTIKDPVWRPYRPSINIKLAHVPASKSRWDSSYPHDYSGPVQLLLPFRFSKAERERKKAEAYRQFFETIPPEVRDAIALFKNRQWHILQLVARCPGGLDLVHSNAALAFCLASNWVFHKPPVCRPLRSTRSLLKRRQREALRWLCFHGTEAARKIVRKIPPHVLTVPGLLYLRDSMCEAEVMKILAHIPRINSNVIRIVSDPVLFSHCSPRFLEELGLRRNDDRIPHSAYFLRDLIEMANILRPRGYTMTFRSHDQLVEIHNELVEDMLNIEAESVYQESFPPPPIPGTEQIIPLTSGKELLEEGRIQHNCIGSYSRRVVIGNVYIYKILSPQRATLSITMRQGGMWVIGELKLKSNRRVGKETFESVKRWLDENLALCPQSDYDDYEFKNNECEDEGL